MAAVPVAAGAATVAAAGSTSAVATGTSSAVGSGVAAAGAQMLVAPMFTWMHTIMSYQYRYGGSFARVARSLYLEGGVARFYQGFSACLIHVPLLRLGSIVAMEKSFETFTPMGVPDAAAAGLASAGAAVVRVSLMPLTCWSTLKQVQGERGTKIALTKLKTDPASLWAGSTSAVAATVLGNATWCFAYKKLSDNLPKPDVQHGEHLHAASVGFLSNAFSDMSTNALRVLTTFQQTQSAGTSLSVRQFFASFVKEHGVSSLLGRGLGTRILMGGAQGAVFTTAWKAVVGAMESC